MTLELSPMTTRTATWTAVTAAREWLDRELKATIGEQEIRKLATRTKLKRLLGGTQAQPAEVFWAWASEATALERMERGWLDRVVPEWREESAARMRRWREGTQETGEGAAGRAARRRQQRTLRAMRAEAEDWRQGEVVTADPGVVRRAWQRAKGNYAGAGGYKDFHRTIAQLMIAGEIEGAVDMEVGSWWQEEWRDSGREGTGVERLERREVEEGRRVLVDFGSGTQSAAVLLGPGDLYVPIDRERWVFSQKRGCWVENVVLDLEEVRAGKVWELVRAAVRRALGCDLGRLPSTRVVLWMSPPCRTFSKTDASNRNRKDSGGRGCGFRDHRDDTRPPLDRHSAKGKMAGAADRLVQLWLQVALLWAVHGVQWAMENPEGSLARRPYMRAMVGEHVVRQARVDYCAYGRKDMKPTHIWTSVWSWVPRGTTGDGRCQGMGACHAMSGTRHEESVTGGKKKRGAGQGAKAAKSAVPVQLLEEWYEAATRRRVLI